MKDPALCRAEEKGDDRTQEKIAAPGSPFRSLRDGNFRLYWCSMCLSSLAIWIQNAAQPWLAYSMTDSPMLLGTVSALQFMPLLLLSPVSGVLIDRFSKRTLLLVSQAGFVGTSLFMAGAVFSGRVSFGVVALVAVLTGLINVINLPLRQAWISSLVAEEMVVNAVALYSAAFNLARILGPAAAGFLMEGLGLGCCYALNAGLFLCALLGLAFVREPHPRRRAPATLGAIREDMRSGVRYVAGHRAVLSLLAALGTAGIFSINYSVLLPVLAVEVLDRGEVGYGMLMSVMGVGTFLGAFTVAAGRKGEPSAFFLRVSPGLLALTWFVVAGCDGIAVYAALAANGFFYVSFSSSANVALQLWSDPAYVGRVISFYTLVLAGTSPIGNLYAGRLSDRFGVRVGCAACAAAALVCMGLIRVLERRGENKTGS